jgi:hypothetical protein
LPADADAFSLNGASVWFACEAGPSGQLGCPRLATRPVCACYQKPQRFAKCVRRLATDIRFQNVLERGFGGAVRCGAVEWGAHLAEVRPRGVELVDEVLEADHAVLPQEVFYDLVKERSKRGQSAVKARSKRGQSAVRLQPNTLAPRGAPPPPPSRTKWTRRVPHPVLIGHAASLTPY